MSPEEFIELCESGTAAQVREALRAGANPNARTEDGTTTLMWAADTLNNSEIVKALIRAGADVNARNKAGATALMLAADSDDPEAIDALLDAGADADAGTEAGGGPSSTSSGMKI